MSANPITEDRESEARDKVDPLIKKGVQDGNGSSQSQPFDSIEKIDSLMISSDENSLGYSHHSNMAMLRKPDQRDKIELYDQIFRDAKDSRILRNRRTLSKFMSRQLFNRFKELPSASKNMFSNEDPANFQKTVN